MKLYVKLWPQSLACDCHGLRQRRICSLFFWMKIGNTALTGGVWCQRAAAAVAQELQSRAVGGRRPQNCSYLMGEVLTESETVKQRERLFSKSVQGQFNQKIPQRGRAARKQKRWIKQSERLLMSPDGLTKHLRTRIKALSVWVWVCVSMGVSVCLSVPEAKHWPQIKKDAFWFLLSCKLDIFSVLHWPCFF